MSNNLNIIIVEPSAILFEGLQVILSKSGLKPYISHVSAFDEIQQLQLKRINDIIIMSPAFIQNNVKQYNALKNQFSRTRWIAFIYAFYEQHLLSLFDATITISDPTAIITATISGLLNATVPDTQDQLPDIISDREIEVLKQLASGLSNKEIADKLNISINTVITHRKNISQKTGIKSVSGLTIYAILKKIVIPEDFSD